MKSTSRPRRSIPACAGGALGLAAARGFSCDSGGPERARAAARSSLPLIGAASRIAKRALGASRREWRLSSASSVLAAAAGAAASIAPRRRLSGANAAAHALATTAMLASAV